MLKSIFGVKTPLLRAEVKKSIIFSCLSSQEIKDLKAPHCQRLVDPLHVQSIYNFQKSHHQKYGEFFFILPVVIAQFESVRYVIDGQHRIACVERLSHEGENVELTARLITVGTMEELEEKYEALNQNKPVPKGPLKDWKSFVKPVEQHCRKQYAKFLSPSENPRAPNFNVLQLSDYLRKHNVAQKFDYNAKQFIKIMEKLNKYYSNTYETSIVPHFRTKSRITKQIELAHKKNPPFPCLLGLFRKFEWVARIEYHTAVATDRSEVPFSEMDHFPLEPCGKKIETQLRRKVWDAQHADVMKGKCTVCRTELDYDTFVCGHRESRFLGGATLLSNLRPVCVVCNQDMGGENMDSYAQRLKQRLQSLSD